MTTWRRYVLLVKGSPELAVERARELGFEWVTTVAQCADSTTLTALHQDEMRVYEWYHEPGEAPYPAGALLWWRTDEDEEEAAA